MTKNIKCSFSCLVVLSIIALSGCHSDPNDNATKNILSYVNPMIGTAGSGHNYPGATVPRGMVQLSPDTILDGWHSASGYWDSSDYRKGELVETNIPVYGFSHTHLSGTGITELGDILVLPYILGESTEQDVFDKKDEFASPGYYKTQLKNSNIKVELTATTRVGVHRYTYPKNSNRELKFDIGHTLLANAGESIENEVSIVDRQTIKGFRLSQGQFPDQKIYFYAQFSEPMQTLKSKIDGDLILDEDITTIIGQKINAKDLSLYFSFGEGSDPLEIKVAISSVSEQGAEKNFKAEVGNLSFAQVRVQAEEDWIKELSVIQIEGGSENEKTNFYTALYHVSLAPVLFEDVDKQYQDLLGNIRTRMDDVPNYSVYSTWDTYRAVQPLETIIRPSMAKNFAMDLVRKYEDSQENLATGTTGVGLLPRWEGGGRYATIMPGYSAVPIIADAAAKGLLNASELKRAFLAADSTANITSQDAPQLAERYSSNMSGLIPGQNSTYRRNEGLNPSSDGGWNNVSYSLELSYDDWAISILAELAGKSQDIIDTYKERGSWVVKHWDDASNSFSPKVIEQMKVNFIPNVVDNVSSAGVIWKGQNSLYMCINSNRLMINNGVASGSVAASDDSSLLPFVYITPLSTDVCYADRNPFDPLKVDAIWYAEGNSYQWKWSYLQNIDGELNLNSSKSLIELMKNKHDLATDSTGFEETLDAFFSINNEADIDIPDLTGWIGQYVHGNEPSHHVIYLYNWTKSAYKTQEYIDYVQKNFYLNRPDGIIGNEDAGQMSAWYVMSALGFYQVTPANPKYSIGRPIFDKVTINLENAKTLHIIAHNNSPKNKYVESVTINGKVIDESTNWRFTYDDIKNGGELVFEMSATH